MALRKASPGEGGQNRHVHFGYVSTAPGKPWHAWCAGPCYWCIAHTAGRSKPCLRWLTGGALSCPRCAAPKEPEEIGYQPLYRDIDGRPVMVIVHSYSREQVDALKFRQQVIVGRGLDPADPVMVSAVPGKQAWYHSTLAERQVPADLTDTLLRVWQIPELVAWYRAQSDTAVSLTPDDVRRSDGKPFDPMHAAAARRFAPPAAAPTAAGELFDGTLSGALARTKSAETNGKHKGDKKG